MSATILDDRGVIIACPQCGQKNRTPYTRLNQTGTCGKCQHEIRPPSEPIDVNTATQFDTLINTSILPVVVDFWAPWCGPCKKVAPELVKVAANSTGQFIVAKVNTDALPMLGQRFSIQSIPTMSVFHAGKELTRTSGARPAAAIETFVKQAVASG